MRHPTKSNLSFSLFFPRGTAGPSDDQRFRVLERGGDAINMHVRTVDNLNIYIRTLLWGEWPSSWKGGMISNYVE